MMSKKYRRERSAGGGSGQGGKRGRGRFCSAGGPCHRSDVKWGGAFPFVFMSCPNLAKERDNMRYVVPPRSPTYPQGRREARHSPRAQCARRRARYVFTLEVVLCVRTHVPMDRRGSSTCRVPSRPEKVIVEPYAFPLCIARICYRAIFATDDIEPRETEIISMDAIEWRQRFLTPA